MIRNNSNVVQKLVSVFILWCMVAGSIFSLISIQIGGAEPTSPEPMFVPAVIDGETFELTDAGVYDADYSITVQNNGVLKIVDSTLNFLQDANTDYSLTVNTGGTLILENSTITTGATPLAAWNPLFSMDFDAATFIMERNSALAFPGWFNVTDTETFVNDSWITSIYSEDMIYTDWAADFPSYMNAMDDDWWAGTPYDLNSNDNWNDAPVMTFTDCDEVTIADSRIDELYEDDNMLAPVPWNVTFMPSVATASAGSVDDITSLNLQYMEVYPSGGSLFIDSFDTLGFNDMDYQVNSVQVHTLYNTTHDGISGYNGTDDMQWRLDAGIYAGLGFDIENNYPPWAENTSAPLVPTPTLSEISTMDVLFQNTELSADGTVFFDLVELIVNLQMRYDSYPTQILLDNTDMSIINTFVDVDWLSTEEEFSYHNVFNLTTNSNLYLYNMSYHEDDGSITGMADFLEIPLDETEYDLYTPYLVDGTSQVYNYKWLDVKVVDLYGQPVENAAVTSVFNHEDDAQVTLIGGINDLSDNINEKARMIDYLNRKYGVDENTFNITGADGKAMIPLLTEFIDASEYLTGDHVGNYLVDIDYTYNFVDYQGSETAEFAPYPNNMPEDNVMIVQSHLTALELPRTSEMPGLLVNSLTGDIELTGVEDEFSDLAITDFIIVEDDATLDISNFELVMLYSGKAPFEIIVRDTGTLNMNMVNINTQNNRPIAITVEDGGTFTMTDSSTKPLVDIEAMDTSTIGFNRTILNGDFDLMGAPTLWAWDTMFSYGLSVTGTSDAHLVGCYSPLSPAEFISVSDSAQATIYKWIDITVYDGMDPANPLENVELWIDYQSPTAEASWNRHGFTDMDGNYIAVGLCNVITPSGGNTAYTSYDITYYYEPGDWLHQDTIGGSGLAAYPYMAPADAVTEEEIVLVNVLPDLDPPLTVEPQGVNNTVGRGDTVWINSTVSNQGDATAEDINVWINDTFDGDVDIIYDEKIDVLMPGENKTISFEYTWSSVDMLGEHEITIMVDPLKMIPEQLEDNNFNSTPVNVTPQADLAIRFNTDVSFSETYPLINTEFDIMANVWNLGDIDATDVVVSFYYISNGTTILLGNSTVANIPANPSVPGVATLTTSFDTAGTYSIIAIIDEAGNIPEVDETNNDNSLWPRSIRIYGFPELNLDQLDILIGSNPVEYGIGGGTAIDECFNRTAVTLRARVINNGDLHASNVRVQFWDGTQSLGTSTTVSTISSGGYNYFMISWTATTVGLTQNHNIRAIAYGTDLTSNELAQTLTVRDDRPDLALVNSSIENDLDILTDGNSFGVNVTLINNGLSGASNINVEVYINESYWRDTTLVQSMGMSQEYLGRLGNFSVDYLGNGNSVTITVPCSSLTEGAYDLFIYVDSELNRTDVLTFDSMDYDLLGDIEETNEQNNNGTLLVEVVIPDLMIRIVTPAVGDNSWVETSEILVTGNVVRVDNQNIGVSGIEITIDIGYGDPITLVSGQGGLFTIGMAAPTEPGNYTVTVSGEDVANGAAWFVIEEPGLDLMLWIIIIIIAVVGVIGGITAYLYFVGLGKTVQCGECGAFIPEGAKKCPKCNVEFEDEVAKCSVCGAWVPIDVKNCPECKTEFTVGTEDLDDYEAKMKRQYDDIVRKFKSEAKDELGAEFTETEFQAWWATKPTFITFDQWLQEEEEMKRMGSKPCQSCGTENSVTAKICHKCGTVMEEGEPAKPKGKKPVEAKPAEAPKEAPKPAEATPVPAEKTADAATAGDKKSCPSCGMEVGKDEKTCPICSYDFEKPPAGGEPPATPPGEGGVRRVVKKPVKRVVKRPVQGGEQQ